MESVFGHVTFTSFCAFMATSTAEGAHLNILDHIYCREYAKLAAIQVLGR